MKNLPFLDAKVMNETLNAACADKRTNRDMDLLVAGNLVRTPQTRDLKKLLGIYALQGMVILKYLCVNMYVCQNVNICITVKNAL